MFSASLDSWLGHGWDAAWEVCRVSDSLSRSLQRTCTSVTRCGRAVGCVWRPSPASSAAGVFRTGSALCGRNALRRNTPGCMRPPETAAARTRASPGWATGQRLYTSLSDAFYSLSMSPRLKIAMEAGVLLNYTTSTTQMMFVSLSNLYRERFINPLLTKRTF